MKVIKKLDQYTNQGGFHGEGARYTIFKTNTKQLSSELQPTSERRVNKNICYFVEDLK